MFRLQHAPECLGLGLQDDVSGLIDMAVVQQRHQLEQPVMPCLTVFLIRDESFCVRMLLKEAVGIPLNLRKHFLPDQVYGLRGESGRITRKGIVGTDSLSADGKGTVSTQTFGASLFSGSSKISHHKSST